MHARDPHGILKQIFKLFLKKGESLFKQILKNRTNKINETLIKSENDEYKFEKSVIASGAFSKKLTLINWEKKFL